MLLRLWNGVIANCLQIRCRSIRTYICSKLYRFVGVLKANVSERLVIFGDVRYYQGTLRV